MVELAKLLLRHRLSVNIVVPPQSIFGGGSINGFISGVTTANPAISYLPSPSPHHPPASPSTTSSASQTPFSSTTSAPSPPLVPSSSTGSALTRSKSPLSSASHLSSFSPPLRLTSPRSSTSPPPQTTSKNLASNPSTSPASRRCQPPVYRRKWLTETRGGRPASSLPKEMVDRDSNAYKGIVLFHFTRLPLAGGIIVNTLRSLEVHALRAISDGLCIPGFAPPPVYCIGPLIAEGRGDEEQHACLTWLDSQPRESVVFLCFGSLGAFSAEQLNEIALLERSRQRFLWYTNPCLEMSRRSLICFQGL